MTRPAVIEQEAKKLRVFLEDYDDDRDDQKFYRGEKLDRYVIDHNVLSTVCLS